MAENLKPTYGQRKVLNGREIHEHYFGDKKLFENTYHVTVMYSSKPIDRSSIKPDESTILVSPKSEHLIFGKDFKTLDPYTGPIELGPEELEGLQED